ncbi:MAG: hypothetical protein ABR955_03535 [Verrucomicrobiota bacterium]
MQAIRFDLSLADDNAGSNIAARIAMMAITTNSSIKVKALPLLPGFELEEFPPHSPKPKPEFLSPPSLFILMPLSTDIFLSHFSNLVPR